jgi:hypothetical protein
MNVETHLLRVNRDGTSLDYDSNGDRSDEKDTSGSFRDQQRRKLERWIGQARPCPRYSLTLSLL